MRGPTVGLRSLHELCLNSLKGGYIGDDIGTAVGGIKGDTGSLYYGSHEPVR